MLGTTGVGKTHVMNLLATYPNKPAMPTFKLEKDDHKCGGEGVWHTTHGINAYVTSEKLILLGE